MYVIVYFNTYIYTVKFLAILGLIWILKKLFKIGFKVEIRLAHSLIDHVIYIYIYVFFVHVGGCLGAISPEKSPTGAQDVLS